MSSALSRVAPLLLLCSLGCDDTGKAIKEEVQEVDEEQVKQDLKEGAAAVGSAAEKVVDKTKEAIDKVDKKAAEEIRKD